VAATHPQRGERYLYCEGEVSLLFFKNDTNNDPIFGTPNASSNVKDGISDCVVHAKKDAVNPEHMGTKVAAHYMIEVPAGGTETVCLRLNDVAPALAADPFQNFNQILESRRREADEFYSGITPGTASEDEARVMRQALDGVLWTKQYFGFDVDNGLRNMASTRCGPAPGTCATANGSTW
jgi:hypothetical protein